jgi:protein TonB
MSTAATFSKEAGLTTKRRCSPRAPLKSVVLVYFGKNNWGKLADMNETGMCLEYAKPPSPGQRISFTFEAMGRMAGQSSGEVTSDSFQAAGEIKWTREFERTAGVQFLDLAEESREQIRRWVSFEGSAGTVELNDEARPEAPAPQPELLEPVRSSAEEAPKQLDFDGSASGWENSKSTVEPLGTLQSELAAKILDAPTFEAYRALLADEQRIPVPASGLNGWMTRTGLKVVSACLGILAVAAGLKMILPVWARRPEAAERFPSPSVNKSEPSSAKYRSDAGNPFLVEVLDVENRRWLLWFVNKPSKTMSDQAAQKSALPLTRAPLARPAGHTPRQPASAKPGPAHEFTLVTPKVSRGGVSGVIENSLANAVPVVPGEAPPLEAAIGGILAKGAMPAPVTRALPVGGQVKVARLIKAVPPVYPPLAKTNHVIGEVTLDARIDSTGKVTDVEVVSGPTLLRQAAMEALRLWKYEPAQLDGRPVSSHLSVIVKFHFE